MLLAKSESVDIKVNYSSEETDHPNTARIHFVTEAGREFSLVGVSIGGGNIEIVEINGLSDHYRLLSRHARNHFKGHGAVGMAKYQCCVHESIPQCKTTGRMHGD